MFIFSGSDLLNASYNWWGSANVKSAYRRIYDQRRDPFVALLDIEPVLTSASTDCSGVANCSDRGECVGPDRCRCDAGVSVKHRFLSLHVQYGPWLFSRLTSPPMNTSSKSDQYFCNVLVLLSIMWQENAEV